MTDTPDTVDTADTLEAPELFAAPPYVSPGAVVATAWGNAVVDELARLGSAVTWTNVTYQNGWVAFIAPGVQYRKVGDMVSVRGDARNGTNGTAIFTLPSGYRPPYDLYLTALIAGGAVGYTVITAATGAVTANGANQAQYETNFAFSVTP